MRLLIALLSLSAVCVSTAGQRVRAGAPAGSRPAGPVAGQAAVWILPNGRRVTPVGRQTVLGDFPLGVAATPDGKYLVVVNNGAGPQSLQVVETAAGRVVQTLPVPTVFNGIVLSPDGTRVWVAGGGAHAVFEYRFAAGRLTLLASVPVFGYPSGLALGPGGKTLYVTCNLARHVSILDTQTRAEIGRIQTGTFPFAVALAPDGRTAYVTNWGDGTVSVLDTGTRTPRATLATGGLPCAMVVSPDGRRVYVANANTDSISVLDAETGARLLELAVAPYPGALYGSVPNGLALSPDGRILYATLAGNNAVVAYAVDTLRPIAAYPTAWYPTGILCSRDGDTLYVLSSKGTGSGPNPRGGYIGYRMDGMLSSIPTHTGQHPEAGFEVVARNNGYLTHLTPLPPSLHRPTGRLGKGVSEGDRLRRKVAKDVAGIVSPFPVSEANESGKGAGGLGGPGPPLQHCVLIVRENRTYDQVLGDRKPGNGDPRLTLYGRKVTPNLHALADRFAVGDNFYSDGEVSAQGHQWTLGANCPDYVEKTWMADYSERGRLRDSPFAPITYPSLGYCIDHCVGHGVSCRMYGDVVRIGKGGKPLPDVADKFDPKYKGWDLEYPDTGRAAEWLREFRMGIFPAFSYIWLPNDHTAGTRLGSKTPRALIAENDLATGQIIDAISHSRYWASTAIFLCEDDSQDGRDHVDAHRNVLLVASPWVRAGAVTVHHYSQASVWATLERFLGLPPMSQYDQLADPIEDIWTTRPDLRPYTARPAQTPLDERNTRKSALWRASARLDLDEADADRTGLLESILWQDAHLKKVQAQ